MMYTHISQKNIIDKTKHGIGKDLIMSLYVSGIGTKGDEGIEIVGSYSDSKGYAGKIFGFLTCFAENKKDIIKAEIKRLEEIFQEGQYKIYINPNSIELEKKVISPLYKKCLNPHIFKYPFLEEEILLNRRAKREAKKYSKLNDYKKMREVLERLNKKTVELKEKRKLI